jgi:hypothetical protein
MTSGLVDVVSGCLVIELCETLKLASVDVCTSSLKECALDVFVRSTVRRDLAHNVSD